MSNSSDSPQRTGPLAFIKNPQDFWGGIGLLVFAGVALWASRALPGQQGFAFGPGTAPRLFIMVLIAISLIIVVTGLTTLGPALEKWNLRGPLFVLGGVLAFAASIRPLGLIISAFGLVVISGMASRETRWLESIIWGAVLAAFCAFLFPYVLNLPMQLWPRF